MALGQFLLEELQVNSVMLNVLQLFQIIYKEKYFVALLLYKEYVKQWIQPYCITEIII